MKHDVVMPDESCVSTFGGRMHHSCATDRSFICGQEMQPCFTRPPCPKIHCASVMITLEGPMADSRGTEAFTVGFSQPDIYYVSGLAVKRLFLL